MESVHGLWTVGRFTESSQGFCVCLYSVNILVLCFAACENSDLVRTRCHTNAPICTFAMFVMLYLEKKIPQPPPESCYINRIGIKWLFWLKKRHGPPQKSCHTGSPKTGYGHPLGLNMV